MSEKLITILTPVYNKAPYIVNWAKSLAKQTYLDKTKILVTDDGSTDDSLAQVKKYSAEYNLPVEIFCNEKNLGLMYTIKTLYRKIDTKFFAVLDADDYYISDQKIEKAVKFLETHEDYSCYACNSVNIYPDNKRYIALSRDLESQTFSKCEDSPFFQTASTTFRNFFSTKLLDAIDKITEGHRKHAFQGDAFRNILAFRLGKIYFENSLDCVWLKEIGIWGTASPFSQDIANMRSYLSYYNFLVEQFGEDEVARTCLKLSLGFYQKIINEFYEMIDVLDVQKFDFNNEFNKLSQISNEDIDNAFNALLSQYKKFSEIEPAIISEVKG